MADVFVSLQMQPEPLQVCLVEELYQFGGGGRVIVAEAPTAARFSADETRRSQSHFLPVAPAAC